MEAYLQSLEVNVWQLVKNVYSVPKTTIVDIIIKILYENNARVRNAILCGLEDSEFTKVMQCTQPRKFGVS